MKRVFLVGASGWGNVGDDLIAVRIVDWLKKNGAEVVVSGGNRFPVPLPDGTRFICADGSVESRLRMIWSIVRSSHIVIGGGGLLDDRSPSFYRPFFRVARIAKAAGRPYSFVAVGVGPVRNESTREDYLQIVRHAAAVSVRDIESRDRLRKCGVDREIEVVSDPALWRRSAPNASPTDRFDLTINLRCWADRDGRRSEGLQGGLERITREVADCVNRLHGPGSRIALVSMSELDGDQDSAALEVLSGQLVGEVSKIYSCDMNEIDQVVNESRSVLSMRLHLCLIATSQGKPVVGIGYDPKIGQQGQVHGFSTVDLDGDFSAGKMEIALTRSLEVQHLEDRTPVLPSVPL